MPSAIAFVIHPAFAFVRAFGQPPQVLRAARARGNPPPRGFDRSDAE